MLKSNPEIEVFIPSLKTYLQKDEEVPPVRRPFRPARSVRGVFCSLPKEDDDETSVPEKAYKDEEPFVRRPGSRYGVICRTKEDDEVATAVPGKIHEMEGLISPAEYKADRLRVTERRVFQNGLWNLSNDYKWTYDRAFDTERASDSEEQQVFTVRGAFKKGIQSQTINGELYADCLRTLSHVVKNRFAPGEGYDALDFFLEYLPAFLNTLSPGGISTILRTFVAISYDRDPEFMHGVVGSLLDAPAFSDIESLDSDTACSILLNCFMLGHTDSPVIKKLIARVQHFIDANQIQRPTASWQKANKDEMPRYLHRIHLLTGLLKKTDELFQKARETRGGTSTEENNALYEAVKEILGEDFMVSSNTREERTDYELDVGVCSTKRRSYPRIDIECDGYRHRTLDRLTDGFRDRVLGAVGWDVVRFKNDDVMERKRGGFVASYVRPVKPDLKEKVFKKLTESGLFFSDRYLQRKTKKDAEITKRFGGLDIGKIRKEAMQTAVYNGFEIGLRGDDLRKVALVVSRQVDQVLNSSDSPDIPTVAKRIVEAVKVVLEHKKESVID